MSERETITIASKVHTSIRLADDHPDGRVVVIGGSRYGDETITERVDKESFGEWFNKMASEPIASLVRIVTPEGAAGDDAEGAADGG